MSFRISLSLLRLQILDFLYFLSSENSDSLNDEYDNDRSDSGSSRKYSYTAFSLRFEDSVGYVSGLGSDIFVPTGDESKCDIFAFVVFVPIGFESKGGQLIKCFGAQISCYLSKFETQFYSYIRGLT